MLPSLASTNQAVDPSITTTTLPSIVTSNEDKLTTTTLTITAQHQVSISIVLLLKQLLI